MNKYYRVRTKVQWGWLMKWFEEQDENIKWSYNDKPTGGISDLLVGILLKRADIVVKLDNFTLRVGNVRNREVIGKKLIEVSQMMEGEKMKDYVTIHSEDLEKIKVDYGQMNDVSLINHDVDGKMYIHERFLPADLMVPKSLLYPKIQFTEAEKKEFDSIDNDETLSNALDIIELEDYPNLYGRIYYHTVPEYQKFELEFARAWADPSLIEVLPEKKWNVRVPATSYQMYYYKLDDKISTYMPSQSDLKNDKNSQFTAKELKHYGLDNDLFEKVEVKE